MSSGIGPRYSIDECRGSQIHNRTLGLMAVAPRGRGITGRA
jgi:hypothetical protein